MQITGNLLDNALEAAAPAGRVDLLIKTSKIGLQIKASNTCEPISQSDQKRMFAVGYTTKKKEHSGLGLYTFWQAGQQRLRLLKIPVPSMAATR